MEHFVGLIALVFAAGLRRNPERGRQDALTAIWYLCFGVVATCLAREVGRLRPTTYDVAFLAADRALGLNPLNFMHWVTAHPAAAMTLGVVYRVLAPVMVAAWLIEQNKVMRRALFIGGLTCFGFYYAFPAVGPGLTQWIGRTVPNCMPSMHMTWALLLAWNARSRWLKITLWTYAVLVAFSTIGLGEHYYIDLMGAVPFTVGLQWVSQKLGRLSIKVPKLWKAQPACAPSAAGERS
jgi:membrane-associated phospholipid phosphatase